MDFFVSSIKSIAYEKHKIKNRREEMRNLKKNTVGTFCPAPRSSTQQRTKNNFVINTFFLKDRNITYMLHHVNLIVPWCHLFMRLHGYKYLKSG